MKKMKWSWAVLPAAILAFLLAPGTAPDFALGQASTATTGGALRVVDGGQFPLTVAGVQAALDEAEAAGGGTVQIPSGANILVTNTSVKIGNGVKLVGTGDHTQAPTFTANATTNVSAMVENKTQNGRQQYAYVTGIYIEGNKAGGARVARCLNFKHVYLGSAIKDVLVNNCHGNGLVIDGGEGADTDQAGPVYLGNVTVARSDDDNILITGGCNAITMDQVASESVAAGKAQIRITRGASKVASTGHSLTNIYFEGIPAADGLVLNETSHVSVNGLTQNSANATSAVTITGSTAGSDGAFAAGGHTLDNILGNISTIINDRVAGVVVGNAQGRFIRRYQSPIASATLDKSQSIGLQLQRLGQAITAASTIDPDDGNFFVVKGTATIDNITNAARYSGKVLELQTTSPLTIKHNSGGSGDIRLSGAADFRTAANQIVSFVSDGALWWQESASIFPETRFVHLVNDQGRALAIGDIVPSPGWGTGSAVTSISGRNSAMKFTVTSGTTVRANPTITVTFPAAFTGAPACSVAHGSSDISTRDTWTTSTTALTIAFNGTPTPGLAHDYQVVCIGT
jgi:hypothetical protein